MQTDTVQEAHSSRTLCVEHDTTVREVLTRLKAEQTGGAFVLRDGQLTGIYTERDALKLMANGGDLDIPVSKVMTERPMAVREDESVASAIAKMSRGGYRRLPIVDEAGRPAGSVKTSGILRYLVEHFPQSVYNLPPASDSANKDREGA